MRWDALFGDLAAQWEADQQVDLALEASETLEHERAQIPGAWRVRAHGDSPVLLHVRSGESLRMRVTHVGADWLSGHDGHRDLLVPWHAVIAAEDLEPRGQPESSRAAQRLGLGVALRELSRRRESVVLYGPGGEICRGVISAVGADHLDVVRAGARGPQPALSASGAESLRRTTVWWQALVCIASRPA